MIKNYTETTIKLSNIPEQYKSYIPRMLEQECSFTISGINNAIAGAIIRTIGGELPVRYLRCDSVETNDRFIIEEMVAARIQLIPIKQSIPIGTKYNLNYTNKSQFLETIKTSYFDGFPQSGLVPFNQNITICKLNKMSGKDSKQDDYEEISKEKKGKKEKLVKKETLIKKEKEKEKKESYLSIRATVASASSYIPGFGGLSLAHHCVAIPSDNKEYDQYAKTGIRTSVSTTDTYNIKFITHGTIPPKDLLIMGCDDLINRINRVTEFIPMKTSELDVHTYCIINDSETIGNLFMREILEMSDANDKLIIKSVSYKMGLDTRVVNIMIRGDNTDKIIQEAIKSLIAKFEKIKKSF